MKSLNKYITEKFQVSKNNIRTYNYYPETTDELIDCIKEKIEKEGLGTKDKPLDLNDIDTSKITDMSNLFNNFGSYGIKLKRLSKNGYFDISDWNVSNVKNMHTMFYESSFDGDLSDWDVSNVEDMCDMFAYSDFTGKNGSISGWDVRNVEDMEGMFYSSGFNGDLSDWDVRNVKYMDSMFNNSPLKNNPPKWYEK